MGQNQSLSLTMGNRELYFLHEGGEGKNEYSPNSRIIYHNNQVISIIIQQRSMSYTVIIPLITLPSILSPCSSCFTDTHVLGKDK